MKTISSNLVSSVNSFFTFFKANKAGNATESDKGNLAVTPDGAIHEARELKEEQRHFSEFQRKAHVGNFFAGPTCVFDPRLFK